MDSSLICLILGLAAAAVWVHTHRRGHLLVGPYGRQISRNRNAVEFWIAQGVLGFVVLVLFAFSFLNWSGLWNAILER